jgi:chromosome partitioning protein
VAIVSLINRKGGVGKTTITLGLADFLSAVHGRMVLVIDVDPQANASLMLVGEDGWKEAEDAELTLATLFERATLKRGKPLPAADDLIRPAARIRGGSGRVDVIVSSPLLQVIEEKATETIHQWGPYAGSPYLILQQALYAQVATAYDDVLIDCPPSMGLITLNALSMSSGYLIVTVPDYVSTVGLTQVTDRVRQHADGLRRRIPSYGTVINRFKPYTRMHATLLAELRTRPEAQPVWDTALPDTINAGGALNQTAGVTTLKQRYGGGTHAIYASFEALAAEYLQRVG